MLEQFEEEVLRVNLLQRQLQQAKTALKESAEFWSDNIAETLATALRTGAAEVVEQIDGFYSTPQGEERLRRMHSESEVKS